MTELFGEGFDPTNEKSRMLVDRQMRTLGVVVAFQTALGVCDDPNAPAHAKVAAARTLAEMGGVLKRADREADAQSGGKELHEMSGDELAAYRNKLERENADLDHLANSLRSSTTKGDAFD